MNCEQKTDIRWELVEVKGEDKEGKETIKTHFWQLFHGDTVVLFEDDEGDMIKTETGRKPIMFCNSNEEIKGHFGKRKNR